MLSANVLILLNFVTKQSWYLALDQCFSIAVPRHEILSGVRRDIVTEDTNLMILMTCYIRNNTTYSLYLMLEPKYTSLNPRQYLYIGKIKEALGDTVCEYIFFLHAYLVFGICKGSSMFKDNDVFRQAALIFSNKNST